VPSLLGGVELFDNAESCTLKTASDGARECREMIWPFQVNGLSEHWGDVGENIIIVQATLTVGSWGLDRLDFAMLLETLHVRDNKIFRECLNEHGHVTANSLISNELAQGNIDVQSDFIGGKIVRQLETRAP
jgi:hypothetical protein